MTFAANRYIITFGKFRHRPVHDGICGSAAAAMEYAMSDCEIFLSRLADKEALFSEIGNKLGLNSKSSDIFEFFRNKPEKCEIKLYVSNEKIENPELDKLVGCFSKSSDECGFPLEIIEDEFLNIIDSEGRITSEVKPRSLVHRDGDLHPTVHIWIIKRMDMGIYVLLQKRASCKDTHPNCFDVSAAGHVTEGDEFRISAVRELYEELGLEVTPEKLDFIGMQKNYSAETINGAVIKDNELSAVYLYNGIVHIDDLKLQASEVSEVCWAEIDELLSVMKRNAFRHCIRAEELFKIKKAVF